MIEYFVLCHSEVLHCIQTLKFIEGFLSNIMSDYISELVQFIVGSYLKKHSLITIVTMCTGEIIINQFTIN